MTQSYLITDDLTDYLGVLPDWYIQTLEDREENACDVCPDEWIEISLTDFDGVPITGEPWFVFQLGTDANAVSPAAGEIDPSLNGAGQTTPTRLPLLLGTERVDIAFGTDTMVTRNLTDEEFGDEYFEQLYIEDSPAEYDGPLNIPTDHDGLWRAGAQAINEINAARAHNIPSVALVDMLGELDLAIRAALGVYEDISLTARNKAEADMMLVMQGRPPDYHLLDGMEQMFTDAEFAFEGRAPAVFVGPDGVVYGDNVMDIWQSPYTEEFQWWRRIIGLLNMIADYTFFSERDAIFEEREAEEAEAAGEDFGFSGLFVSAAHASPNRGGSGSGGVNGRGGGRFISSGKGSNPRRNLPARSPTNAHSKLSSRKPSKPNRTLNLKGAKFQVREAMDHFFRGGGVKANGQIYGGHTTTTYTRDTAAGSLRHIRNETHPSGSGAWRGISRNTYQGRRQAGSQGQGGTPLGGQYIRNQPKTVVDLSVRGPFQVMRDFRQALRNAAQGQVFKANSSYQTISGYTNTGVKMRFHISGHGNGSYTIRSFYYDF
ncbi:hypothetical protein [Parasulfitobacter algicola]|uniref:Uncharacterized protein n=1 Tax=Parasulfitobacter algicola TaxID=2614809 RepID=A0ABX2IZ25_9RHOB|nr:hypothetical protein [Sulfitobacter algicola]NSX55553.1 hypothetical protein [Sulfitobacter algicola]